MQCAYTLLSCDLPGSTAFFLINSQMARFLKKVMEHKTCVMNFSQTFVWNNSLSKKNSVRKIKKVFMWWTHYSGLILMKLDFLDRFLKNTQISNSQKSVQQKLNCSMRRDTWKAVSLFTILRLHLKRVMESITHA